MQIGEKTLVFIYDSLRKGYWNHHLITMWESSTFVGEARTVDKYALTIGDFLPMVYENPKLYHIEGEIWSVGNMCLHRLDMMEGNPRLYCRKRVDTKVIFNNNILKTWVYFSANPHCEHKFWRIGDYSKIIYPSGYQAPYFGCVIEPEELKEIQNGNNSRSIMEGSKS